MLNAGRMTNPDDLKQLAPTEKLRGGVVVSPAASAFFAIRNSKGDVQGVTVDLIRAFADTLKLPLALQVYDNSGQVTDAVASAACDLAFMPQDAERAKKVDFGRPIISSPAPIWCPPVPKSKASMRSTGRACASSPFPTPRLRAARVAPRPMPRSRKYRVSIR